MALNTITYVYLQCFAIFFAVANCPVLSIDNGMVMQSTTLGSMAAYNCDAGYNLQGNGARTCQADSSWTGTPPDCTGIATIADCVHSVVLQS